MLRNLFKKSKDNKDEFEQLNDACNAAFEGAFNKCRLVFGREMVEIIEMKSRLLDVLKSTQITAAQELLAKKLLELIVVYFRIIEVYVSVKRDNHPESANSQELDERIGNVYSLINNLNTQFYLNSNELTGMSAYDEIINEAEALRNVIKENYIKYNSYH